MFVVVVRLPLLVDSALLLSNDDFLASDEVDCGGFSGKTSTGVLSSSSLSCVVDVICNLSWELFAVCDDDGDKRRKMCNNERV